jgi:DNA replication protein DnaC
MTAFLKIDNCNACRRPLPWEWVPAVLLNRKPMAGTGVWRSQLIDGRCPACQSDLETRRQKEQRAIMLRTEMIELMGGEKPHREFTFERYRVTPENRLSFERCTHFDPVRENLYLRGPCGVGKTHLAYAVARRLFVENASVAIVRAYQISRKVRMKGIDREQEALDELIEVRVLVLDDLGIGSYTPYSRQLLQEILDGRDFADRGGLIVTSPYSLGDLAIKLSDDTIASRLAGMCRILAVQGVDGRLGLG